MTYMKRSTSVRYADMMAARKKRKRSPIFAYRIALLRKLAWIDYKILANGTDPYGKYGGKIKISRMEFVKFIEREVDCSSRTAKDYAKFLCWLRS